MTEKFQVDIIKYERDEFNEINHYFLLAMELGEKFAIVEDRIHDSKVFVLI